jgi:ABC-2 type transport system ATP-binding protein
MNDLVINTYGLRKEFGAKTAVADLTLSVRRAEVFGFLGPNGAGKTTSVKMLLGLVKPTSGTAEILGAPLGNVAVRSRLGFLPEHFRFHDWLTGREFLHYHGQLYRMPARHLKVRIDELLTRVDLLDAADRRLREYSKGMLQRVGLAQALLNEPELLFLDEPTSGLDPLGRLLVRDLIQELRAKGTAVFLNSHLLSEVEITCDRVAFVKKGEVVRETSLGDTVNDLEVELKLGAVSPEILAGLARFGREVHSRDSSVRLRVGDEEVLPELNAWLVSQGVRVYRVGAIHRSLESVFLEIMGADERPG